MTDTPSSILLLRLQSVGSNTNLWGGYLNTGLQTLERAAKGYQALAVTGDATVSWTNYSASNDGAVASLNGLGAKAITKNGSTALERSDIAAGAQRLLTYDGTQFQISGVAPAQPGASEGLFMSTNFSNWGLLQ